MKNLLYPFPVLDRHADREVSVDLYADLVLLDLIEIERVWVSARLDVLTRLDAASVPRKNWPESWHWNWQKKAAELDLLSARVFAVYAGEKPEAVMMVKTVPYVARLAPDTGKPIVYIDFLEVAPWNWTVEAINQAPQLTGLGSQLVQAAVAMSVDEGFRGRVGLHSLPQSEKWYSDEKRGFIRIGSDLHKQGLIYFERPTLPPHLNPNSGAKP